MVAYDKDSTGCDTQSSFSRAFFGVDVFVDEIVILLQVHSNLSQLLIMYATAATT